MPGSEERAFLLVMRSSFLGGIAFGLLHAWVAFKAGLPSRYVQWSVGVLGGNCILGSCMMMGFHFVSTRRSRTLKLKLLMPISLVPVRVSTTFTWVSAVYLFLLGGFCLTVLFAYLKKLPIDWLRTMETASLTLAAICIAGVLLYRGLYYAAQSSYASLQRDILLERLSAQEIRSRFIRDTLGEDVAMWLDEFLVGVREEDAKLKKACASAGSQLEEIRAIDPAYRIERNARAKKALNDIEAALGEHRAKTRAFDVTLKQFAETHESRRDHVILEGWMNDARAKAKGAEDVSEQASHLITNLKQFTDETAVSKAVSK